METSYGLRRYNQIPIGRSVDALIGVAFFVLATAMGAYVRIPVPGSPVPITLQTFFVIMSGAVLGRRMGALSQAIYLALGAAGLPLFQGASSGFLCIAGPTGGYLIGFIAAAYVIGRFAHVERPVVSSLILCFVSGILIIYASGVLWLAHFYHTGLRSAISMGALPFIPADAAKVLLAATLYSGMAGRARQIFPA